MEHTKLGNLAIPRIVNGMWQVSGSHGAIDPGSAIPEMIQYHEAGLVAWDMADIYGPAEEFYGKFRDMLDAEQRQKSIAFTKFVPNPAPMNRNMVEHHISRSIKRMNVDSIDLLQFHWWDYQNPAYMDALRALEELRTEGRISHVALTNFDTHRMRQIIDGGVRPVSNQVQYSILDGRPQAEMVPFCLKHGIKLLTYGTLLGGFLSEGYLGRPEPRSMELATASLKKYKNMIDAWGGWQLFQKLLSVLDGIAKKHDSSIANVGVRCILDRPAVAAVIVGARLGVSNHIGENLGVFSLRLDSDDHSGISSVTDRANDLYSRIGDCGAEYR